MIKTALIFILLSTYLSAGELMIEKKKRSEDEWVEVIKDEILHVIEEEKEFTLPAGQRIDLFDKMNNTAYEVDWASKWTEGIGQSLIYAIKTNCDPGLILLMKTGEDEDYLNAMIVVTDLRRRGYEYKVMIVNVDTLKYWKF